MGELGEDGHRLGELPRGLPHGQAQELAMSVLGENAGPAVSRMPSGSAR